MSLAGAELLSRNSSRADSRLAPSQWEAVLLCNDVSHWLGANLEWALLNCSALDKKLIASRAQNIEYVVFSINHSGCYWLISLNASVRRFIIFTTFGGRSKWRDRWISGAMCIYCVICFLLQQNKSFLMASNQIKPWTKWLTFCRWHFQKQFLARKVLYFDSDFSRFCSVESLNNEVAFASSNGLVSKSN